MLHIQRHQDHAGEQGHRHDDVDDRRQRKHGIPKNAKFQNRMSHRQLRQINKSNASPPAVNAATTVVLPQPAVPTVAKAYNNPPKPIVERMTPATSSLGRAVSEIFFHQKKDGDDQIEKKGDGKK